MRRSLGWMAALSALALGCSGSVEYEGADGANLAAQSPGSTTTTAAGSTSGCVPGAQVACACMGAGAAVAQNNGIAVCDAQGALSACRCAPGSTAVMAPPTVATGGNAGSPTTSLPDAPAPVAPPEPAKPTLAGGVRIAQLALYQPVKIPLTEKGADVVDRIAPVIVNKRALLRVFVETLSGYTPRDLTASLELSSSSVSLMPLTVTARIDRTSIDSDLKTSLNFDIPAEAMREDLRYSLSLLEAPGSTMAAAMPADPDARFPKEEGQTAELGARDPGTFRVVIVPYRYQGDSSGRLPVTDEAEMKNYREFLQAQYPASNIQVEMHAPVDYSQKIGQEQGWAEWLDSHCALRNKEKPDPKVFYYGMIQPAKSWRDYGGGVVGISNLPGAAANYGRCSVGIGYQGFAFVAAHELGHALGLEHAPCQTGGDSGPFPYPDALTGVWGYDVMTGKLVDPKKAHDFMSYCDPPFMSDYNYRRLFGRIRYLNVQFDVIEPEPTMYHRVLVGEDGAPLVREPLEFTLPPGGPEETRSLTLLDADGQPMGQSDAFYFPFSQPNTGVWLIPDTGVASVRLEGAGDVQLY